MRCFTCWQLRAKPACRWISTIFRRVSERTPLLADLKPAGKFVAADVDKAGGIPLIAKRLLEGKYVDGSAITVTGKTFAEEAEHGERNSGTDGDRSVEQTSESHGRPGHSERKSCAGRRRGEDERARTRLAHAARRGCSIRKKPR